MSASDTTATSPWHPGEIALQTQIGVAARMASVGPQVIRDHMVAQHRDFYPLLPFVVLGTVDADDDAWATIRAGRPGFLHAADARHLMIELVRDPVDPADGGLETGDAVGVLGIDLTTRRRNRLNGDVSREAIDRFTVAVEQSFGNCPKYIQLRTPVFVRDPRAPASTRPMELQHLDTDAHALVESADTFFVATYVDGANGERQVDVSHRGGRPGFVRIDDDNRLVIPDFAGNRFFNTLGNIAANPRAGLVFADFATGDLVQMTGRAELLPDAPRAMEFRGAERFWRFTPTKVVARAGALALRFAFDETGWSPHTQATGAWSDAQSPDEGVRKDRVSAPAPLRTARPGPSQGVAGRHRAG